MKGEKKEREKKKKKKKKEKKKKKRKKDDKSIHFAQRFFLAYCVRFVGETASRYNRQRGITLLTTVGSVDKKTVAASETS